MDNAFDFVTVPNGAARPQPAPAQPAAPAFQIPSFRDVQAAQMPSAAPNLFRPGGVSAAPARPASAGPPPPVPHSQTATRMMAAGALPDERATAPLHQPRTAGLAIPSYVQGTAPTAGPSAGMVQRPAGPTVFERPAGMPWHLPPTPSTSQTPLGQGVHNNAGRMGHGPPAAAAPQQQQQAPLPINAIVVNRRQQGNPVLKHIRNVRWQFGDVVPDYQLSQSTGALFLSLRYHLLHPEYILHRIKEQQRLFRLSILLVHIDVDDVVKPLGEITKAAVVSDMTMVCAWSAEECARWLETYKSYESKPASSIQERVEHNYLSRLTSVLTSVRGVNRTDAHTLGTNFGSLAAIMQGSMEDLSACPGIGATKVRRLFEAFNEPFRKPLRPPGLASATQPRTGDAATPPPAAAVAQAAAAGAHQPAPLAPGAADLGDVLSQLPTALPADDDDDMESGDFDDDLL